MRKSLPQPLLHYENEQLMHELNEFMIAVKCHLFNLPVSKKMPSNQEIDILTSKLMTALKKDSKPLIKY